MTRNWYANCSTLSTKIKTWYGVFGFGKYVVHLISFSGFLW